MGGASAEHMWHGIYAYAYLVMVMVILQVSGNDTPSLLIAFSTKTFAGGQLTSKLHVIELGAQQGESHVIRRTLHSIRSSTCQTVFLGSRRV